MPQFIFAAVIILFAWFGLGKLFGHRFTSRWLKGRGIFLDLALSAMEENHAWYWLIGWNVVLAGADDAEIAIRVWQFPRYGSDEPSVLGVFLPQDVHPTYEIRSDRMDRLPGVIAKVLRDREVQVRSSVEPDPLNFEED